jgi:hypothetical protein
MGDLDDPYLAALPPLTRIYRPREIIHSAAWRGRNRGRMEAQAEATCARSLTGGGCAVAVSVPGPRGRVRAPARAMAGRRAGGAKWWRRSRPP